MDNPHRGGRGTKILSTMYVVLLAIVMGDVGMYYKAQYESEIAQLEGTLSEKEETVSELEHYREENNRYSELIQHITQTLAATDQEYGLGGVGDDTVIYDEEQLLEQILSDIENRSPDTWQQHVGQFYSDREDYVNQLPNIWPVKEGEIDRITSGFGLRYSPMDERTHFHEGLDITTSPYNGKVVATAPGRVYGVWRNHPRFGKIVYIRHANGFVTRYAHLSEITVKYQQTVERGEQIGRIGNTGRSNGAHLHYEIRKNGEALDPIEFMLIQ